MPARLLCHFTVQAPLPAIHMLCCAYELQVAKTLTSELPVMHAAILSDSVRASFHILETC